MTIFKNKNFIKRDYEATNVVFCKAEKAPKDYWVEATEAEFNQAINKGMTQLWIEGNVSYWGWL